MKRLAILLAAVSLPTFAAADPVIDHDAALTAAAVAFDTVKTERDKSWNDNALLASKIQTEITRSTVLQADLDTATRDRDSLATQAAQDVIRITTLQSALTAAQAALQACKVAPGCYTAPVPVPPPAPPPPAPPPPSPPPVPVPPPSPPPVPPTGTIPTTGLAPIADGLDVPSLLQPAWGNGAIPPSSKPDVVGAFRFQCVASHEAYDDPIVYPGLPGKSHLHEFYGNTLTNAASTYASLRTTGESTCNNKLNRSAYWQTAMLNGKGGVIRPDFVTIYYKRRPKTDPFCNLYGQKGCVNIPRGLKFIFGFDMLTGKPTTGAMHMDCQGTGSTPGHYANIVVAAKFCPVGAQLGAVIGAPDCWDGKNLDSPNHRDHVAYTAQDGKGHAVCPVTHPYIIPTFTLGSWYRVDADLDRSGVWDGSKPTWHFSSDFMPGMPKMIPGSTFHADWFGAWNDQVLQMWHDNCIDGLKNASGGDTCGGLQIKPTLGYQKVANPHVVPEPVQP